MFDIFKKKKNYTIYVRVVLEGVGKTLKTKYVKKQVSEKSLSKAKSKAIELVRSTFTSEVDSINVKVEDSGVTVPVRLVINHRNELIKSSYLKVRVNNTVDKEGAIRWAKDMIADAATYDFDEINSVEV